MIFVQSDFCLMTKAMTHIYIYIYIYIFYKDESNEIVYLQRPFDHTSIVSCDPQPIDYKSTQPVSLNSICKVEFNQSSCWLYSVPNLLVFQQLETLYLGGNHIKVVCMRECKELLKCVQRSRDLRLDFAGDSQLQAAKLKHTC